MNETTSGYMISSGFGGGIANIEYMTMTGLPLANFSPTLSTPYTQLVSTHNYNPSIVNYFSNAVAIHPYVGISIVAQKHMKIWDSMILST